MLSRDSSGWNWLIATCLAALALVAPSAAPSASAPAWASTSTSTSPSAPNLQSSSGLPSERQWGRDLRRAMRGSHAYIDQVTEGERHKLALNFDIDNHRPGHQLPARHGNAHRLRVRHLRPPALSRAHVQHRQDGCDAAQTRGLLSHADYPVIELCGRDRGEALTHSKQRCRRHSIAQGYTIIANIGKRSTDFYGQKNYDRAFGLPSCGGRLG